MRSRMNRAERGAASLRGPWQVLCLRIGFSKPPAWHSRAEKIAQGRASLFPFPEFAVNHRVIDRDRRIAAACEVTERRRHLRK
jgi:hypothetical protein